MTDSPIKASHTRETAGATITVLELTDDAKRGLCVGDAKITGPGFDVEAMREYIRTLERERETCLAFMRKRAEELKVKAVRIVSEMDDKERYEEGSDAWRHANQTEVGAIDLAVELLDEDINVFYAAVTALRAERRAKDALAALTKKDSDRG